ncbi:MAG: hypothetical protein QNJ54_35640 [Prochloraceae cyanobacterium]|nr:hypothetical protein [Prochloraceae cyanobacterium]
MRFKYLAFPIVIALNVLFPKVASAETYFTLCYASETNERSICTLNVKNDNQLEIDWGEGFRTTVNVITTNETDRSYANVLHLRNKNSIYFNGTKFTEEIVEPTDAGTIDWLCFYHDSQLENLDFCFDMSVAKGE